jgi:signal transduction histidine kinase
VVVSVGRALFRDPFFDPACWANCTDNVFLVRSVPGLARALASGERWLHAAGSAVVLVVLSLRLIHRTPGAGSIVPVLPSALALTIVSTGRLASLWRHPPEDPLESALFAWFVLACLGVIALAAALAWAVVRARRERRAIARTVASLGEVPAPGSLGMALAAAVGDPDLRIAYVLEDPVRLVDGNGRPVEPPSIGEGRSVTTLVREGKPVALVSHLARATDLEREIGPAVRLGLENERLQADVLARLDELQASRTRIVEEGDAERRRLERDLHDGAQQRVLALSFDIRVAIGAAEAAGDEPAATALRAALDRAELALGDLRELAHGIYPAVLSESGLVAAIGELGDVAPIPVSIAADPVSDRFAPAVERAAYLVVAEAIADAARRGAEAVSVRLDPEASSLVVLVEDDGHGDRRRFAAVADRVGATGGRLAFEPGAIRAEIPCA